MHTSTNTSARRGLVLSLAASVGCARVDATVQVVNGPTAGSTVSARRSAVDGEPVITGPGVYALSPSTMTLTLTGIGFVAAGEDPERVRLDPVDDCTVTYDRSLDALASIGTCGASVEVGTYEGVVVGYETRFDMVVEDEVAGIWSDPDEPGLLATTRPPEGARPISVVDTNTDATGGFTNLYFDAPLTIDEASAPEVFVLFDPTHWMKARYDGFTFAPPYAAGNPPILPSVDGFARAAYYTNLGGSDTYRWDGCSVDTCMSLLFLYSDAERPTTVTWQDHAICPGLAGDMAPVVAFAGDDTRWGTFGRLGRDASGTLAWASADQRSEEGSDIVGYNGVYRMPEGDGPGDVVDLAYLCTQDVPAPSAGGTYAGGAPDFAPQATTPLTLLY